MKNSLKAYEKSDFNDKISIKWDQHPKLKQYLSSLSLKTLETMLYDWQIWARDDQLPPGQLEAETNSDLRQQNKQHIDWHIWLLLGGRGSGKTRAGAEWVRAMALGKHPITLAKNGSMI